MVVPLWTCLEFQYVSTELCHLILTRLPAISVLGTFYISSCVRFLHPGDPLTQLCSFLFSLESSRIPNFILAFIPAEINRDTLNTMTAFATGGLLSDVLLHLVPHSFMGEHQEPGIHLVVVEEKRNILIG